VTASRFTSFVLLAVLIVAFGCSGKHKLVEVEGTVKVNGQPVEKIQVEFWPVASGPRSIGVTDAQGRFTLMSDDGKQKGASLGMHKVVLRDVGILGDKFLGRAGEDVDMTKGQKPRIAAIYGDPQTTTLNKEVKSGKNQIDIEAIP
jgi:hypothetical protein